VHVRARVGSIRGLIAAAVAASLLTLAGCSGGSSADVELPSQVDRPLAEEVATRIDDAVARGMGLAAAPGAIVGVWAPWSGFQLSGYGTTEIGGQEPMSPEMHFRAAASTKAMTCTVLLGMVDDGRVALDDPVGEYVTVVGTEEMTLGQLCQSTAGLGNFRDTFQSQFVSNPTRAWAAEELVSDGVARSGDTTPGSAYSGNDTGYVLLAMALENAGDAPIEDLFERYVFAPLGMSQSDLPAASTTALPDPAPHGYQVLGGDCAAQSDLSELSPSMLGAAGGAVTTADDLKRFAQGFAAGAPFTETTVTAQWETVPLGADAPTWQGFGLGGFQFGPMRGQFGDIPGFSTAAFSDPTSGLTVVVMLNASTASPQLVQALALELASYALTAPAAEGRTAPEPSLPWSAEQMQQQSAAAAVCQ
jgi:D-alanyl-D-alanine carboxypeptidase